MSGRKQKQQRVFTDVDIIDTADEGMAVGRCPDGLVILVRGAVPGDKMDVIVIEKRKGIFIAKPLDIKELSANRTDPFCSHFGTCGGCKWQHMEYSAQLHFKEKKVRDAFARIGGLDPALIKPIVGAPLETYYRNKLEYTASDKRWLSNEEMQYQETITDKDGIGFHLSGAFDKVLDIKHCYLQPEPTNEIRLFVKQFCKENNWPFASIKNKTGFIRNIIVRNNLDIQCMIILVVGEDDREKIEMITHALVVAFPQIVSIYSCVNMKVNDSIHDLTPQLEYGAEGIHEKLGNVVFKIGPKSFFQTNSMQAFNLYSIAKELAALKNEDNVFDLYCGVGSLGLFMADQCTQVVGIEVIKEAIDDAKLNATLNGYTNTHFEVGHVELLLDPVFLSKYGKPDIILTDPPRAGMHPDAIRHLLALKADRIVYVSCNPATQARDIKMLSDDYKLITATPVDMFPHTHHIECVALLQRA